MLGSGLLLKHGAVCPQGKGEWEEQRMEGERWHMDECPAAESPGGIPVTHGKPGPP